MAVQQNLSTPLLTINNVAVPYISGTLNLTLGTPEKKMRVQTGGGGSVERVSSIDVTTQFSEIKFEMLNTVANEKLVEVWNNNAFNNAISITDIGFSKYGSNAGITNKLEIGTGPDGKISIEFQCDSLV